GSAAWSVGVGSRRVAGTAREAPRGLLENPGCWRVNVGCSDRTDTRWVLRPWRRVRRLHDVGLTGIGLRLGGIVERERERRVPEHRGVRGSRVVPPPQQTQFDGAQADAVAVA